MKQDVPVHLPFSCGMYVRIPYDDTRDDAEFRDYRIGQVRSIDGNASTAVIAVQVASVDGVVDVHEVERPLHQIERCRILTNTAVTCASTGKRGQVLICCEDTWPDGRLLNYYVLVDGVTIRLSEAAIVVPSSRQDPDPAGQLLRYELHNPSWRGARDLMVESYGELHSATSGIEDLVGSRVVLLAHQAEVIAKVLSSTECRFMLADEVGLGKTIEASVILKGLRRRRPDLRTLIVAPTSLTQQWHNELSGKFWLDFPVAQQGQRVYVPPDGPGVIVSHEDLASSDTYWRWIQDRAWDLLIVDEAHHVHKQPALVERLMAVSRAAPQVLILTATPIQQRIGEYLSLLRLLDPRRYADIDEEAFDHILGAQGLIRNKVVYIRPMLREGSFYRDEFEEEAAEIVGELRQDTTLVELFAQAQAADDDEALDRAHEVMAYISENYRIESRTIRNRRANIDAPLPTRKLSLDAAFVPGQDEEAALEELYSYAERYLESASAGPLRLEYIRVLLHAAASSPHALLELLRKRQARLEQSGLTPEVTDDKLGILRVPAPPRREQDRIERLVAATPTFHGERDNLRRLHRQVEYWHDETERMLASAGRQRLQQKSSHRLIECLRAVNVALERDHTTKVLLFSSWPQTINALLPHLTRLVGRETVALFTAALPSDELQDAANRFQSDESCRALLCDELGGEGRNFQIAEQIVHIDLPWTPAQIEQRIGRVDRLGRTGTVLSLVPVAQGTLEHDLFRIWSDAFSLFTRSMSGLEIALETTQSELLTAVGQSVRQGLPGLLQPMVRQAATLRELVEEERYFEEGAINRRSRDQFNHISERYRDGRLLGHAVLEWSRLAGLRPSYSRESDIATFNPRHFSIAALENAKFRPPNMEEALRRSQNRNTLLIRGTFNRDIAVRREDLVFLAPGDDPWTDSIIANAIEADRGRCCAIRRTVTPPAREWRGFELLFSLLIDPRPLYKQGLDPIHLLQAQGFLSVPTMRILVGIDGHIVRRSDSEWTVTQRAFDKVLDTHLGKRDGAQSPLQDFQRRYPADEWQAMVSEALSTAREHLRTELEFTEELAVEAEAEFQRRATGWEAAYRWMGRYSDLYSDEAAAINEYRRSSRALVEGIRHPLWRLESACFWELQERER